MVPPYRRPTGWGVFGIKDFRTEIPGSLKNAVFPGRKKTIASVAPQRGPIRGDSEVGGRAKRPAQGKYGGRFARGATEIVGVTALEHRVGQQHGWLDQ